MKSNQLGKLVWISVAAFFLFAPASVSAEDEKTTTRENAASKAKTVRIEVDYSDGVQKVLTAVPWKPKMTGGDAMEFATKHKRGVKIKVRGKGANSLLEKIDDLQNGGARGPNWVFRVNGKLGNRSFAITPLNPGDTILWKFDTYP